MKGSPTTPTTAATDQGGTRESPRMEEEGWVLIDKRDALDESSSSSAAFSSNPSHPTDAKSVAVISSSTTTTSSSSSVVTSTALMAQLYARHLGVSARSVWGWGTTGDGGSEPTSAAEIQGTTWRWMRTRWQECERYARHIAHFFPLEHVVEQRQAAAAEERRRAVEDALVHVTAERARQREQEARRQRDSESMYRWLDAIFQRWAAVEAQKRGEEDASNPGQAEEPDTSSVSTAGAPLLSPTLASPPSLQLTQEQQKEKKTKDQGQTSVKLQEGMDTSADPVGRKDGPATVANSSNVPPQLPLDEKNAESVDSKNDEEEERRRLKEEGRKRFREWKKKEESDGGKAIANTNFLTTSAAPTSLGSGISECGTEEKARDNSLVQSVDLEGWEVIAAQETSLSVTRMSLEKTELESTLDPSQSTGLEKRDDELLREISALQEKSKAILRQYVIERMGERNDVRYIPFSYPQSKALAGFDHWRTSLWFAPAGFSQMIEGQTLEAVWMPYYTMRLTVISSFKSKITTPAPAPEGAPADSLAKARKLESKEIIVTQESSHDSLLVCASVEELDQALIKSLESWNIASSLELASTSSPVANLNRSPSATMCPISIRGMISPNDAWKKAEKEIIAREKEACREQIKREHNPQKIQQLILTKLTFKGRPSFSVLYVPIYLITYLHKEKRYSYVVNGLTGGSSGERPYGVGNVIGGGIGLLENIFGINDQETAGILSGQALRKVDNCPYYKDAGWYLVFPPSHSYLITSATGYITLRNAGQRDIILCSQPRGGEKVIATYVLKSGETESFDYKGNWCVEVKYTDADQGQPDIELLEFHPAGGGTFGNKLGMTYWLL